LHIRPHKQHRDLVPSSGVVACVPFHPGTREPPMMQRQVKRPYRDVKNFVADGTNDFGPLLGRGGIMTGSLSIVQKLQACLLKSKWFSIPSAITPHRIML
jgi:hypothetical protein